ncbi:preprotein translocase subunit SecY [Fonticella tunisiensis]|uniref:Protein translocase subunit SecY n=1 Tax=Fonticella tunisiensis TaxID=1096341 RepID=A0A4R7KAI7_9CLOT|nr:preprotein translocase subunit SecY [Fonticella tunisiensis]TDT50414.1 protein translocase subunit secY/sec61 alpha [Fonticella tunisiensis]
MLKTLRNAFKVPDLRKRLFITLALLAVFRAGVFIPVPGVNTDAVAKIADQGLLFGFLDMISGGAFRYFGIFALGVTPYINSSIIMSLLQIAIPRLEQLSKEGEDGRRKIAEYTRYGTILFAVIQAFSIGIYLRNSGALVSNSVWQVIIIIITLTAGTTFVMWLGERITESGVGNGTSLIIFSGILARIPAMVGGLITLVRGGGLDPMTALLFAAFAVLMIAGVVAMDLGERRIPVQYAQRRIGLKSYGGQSTHIPINVNSAGVIAIIFALSVLQFPLIITQLAFKPGHPVRTLFESGWLSSQYPIYPVVYVFLIIFFTWFYTSVTFKPDEVAENLQKNGGFIPGLRPGKPTEEYLTRVLSKMTIIGGAFASIVAIFPIIAGMINRNLGNIQFGGTAVLIVVGVALEINKQLKAQLVMRHYEGFLK